MPRIRGISEKIVYAHNPLPEGVSEEDLIAAAAKYADLDMLEPARIDPFEQPWRYGGTLAREHVTLMPGDFLGLRESESNEFMVDNQEQGMVIVEDPRDEVEVCEKRIKGLTQACKFWNLRGTKRVFEYRKIQGISKEDLVDHTYDLWVFFINQAKFDLCAEVLKAEKAKLIELTTEKE